MSNANWILKNGLQSIDCSSFPYAFRTAYNIVRKAIEAKQDPTTVSKGLTILGPIDRHGDRTKYSYLAAMDLAKDQGLLQNDGNINSREFKRKF